MYAEVLRVISSFENGIASAIRQEFGQTGSLLSIRRVHMQYVDQQRVCGAENERLPRTDRAV